MEFPKNMAAFLVKAHDAGLLPEVSSPTALAQVEECMTKLRKAIWGLDWTPVASVLKSWALHASFEKIPTVSTAPRPRF